MENGDGIASSLQWLDYGLDDSGFESRQGKEMFSVSNPTQSFTEWEPGSLLGDKAAGTWSWPLTFI